MARKIFEQDPVKYIPALAEALKGMKEFSVPEWANYVKTGVSRERPPVSNDFWYTRAASILRQLYIKGVVGVGKLRTRYGSRKDRGGRPDKFFKAGGKVIRVILQQAEAAGLVEKVLRLQHGRRLTAKGRELLDSIEVEAKAGLNFEEISVKPMEISQEDTDGEQTEEQTQEKAVEEVIDVPAPRQVPFDEDKDKSEGEVKESKDEGEVADAE